MIKNTCKLLSIVSAIMVSHNVLAEGGKLLATAGLTQIEGSGGGGFVPWATLAGYDTAEQTAASIFMSNVNTDDYKLMSLGVTTSLYDRVEFSFAQQTLDLPVSLSKQFNFGDIKQNIIGAKVKLFGDVIYSAYPQVSAGLQYKQLDKKAVANTFGAKDDSGIDVYLAATKIHLGLLAGYDLIWNLTARATKANEMGLLGFGGPDNDQYKLMMEGSVGVLLSPKWIVGMEYRQKPNNLSSVKEDDWKDVFVSYHPNKSVNITASYVDLGTIATQRNQKGIYLSMTGYLW